MKEHLKKKGVHNKAVFAADIMKCPFPSGYEECPIRAGESQSEGGRDSLNGDPARLVVAMQEEKYGPHLITINGVTVVDTAPPVNRLNRRARGAEFESVRRCRDSKCVMCRTVRACPVEQDKVPGVAPPRHAKEARKLLNLELFGEQVSQTKVGLNRLYSRLSTVVTKWLSRVRRFSYINSYSYRQQLKANFLHATLISLAPVVEHLLESRPAVRRQTYCLGGLFFYFARPKIKDETSPELLIVPAYSAVARGLVVDAHQKYHNTATILQKMSLDQTFFFLPDQHVITLIEDEKRRCATCARAPLLTNSSS